MEHSRTSLLIVAAEISRDTVHDKYRLVFGAHVFGIRIGTLFCDDDIRIGIYVDRLPIYAQRSDRIDTGETPPLIVI